MAWHESKLRGENNQGRLGSTVHYTRGSHDTIKDRQRKLDLIQ